MDAFTTTRDGNRWWFSTPAGGRVFSIGMNHIDSATLRYPENGHLWRERYGNSQARWIRERVVPDLNDWGFNAIGWVQEVVIRTEHIHRHSMNWTREEYDWAAMPYCHMLPFTEAHQWEVETRLPDVFSDGFEEWCDVVAREHCARLADDPNLIGYFYCDCPTWVHTRPNNRTAPWFDPTRLETTAGRDELTRMAERYYRVTHDAVRRYDPHHLILGDRYEAKAHLPDEILLAARPWVDVLGFQYFGEPDQVREDFDRWHELTGLPVLLADASPPKRIPDRYADMMAALRASPGCVGWHVCGAYLRNRTRKYGYRNEDESPVEDLISVTRQVNADTATWAADPGASA